MADLGNRNHLTQSTATEVQFQTSIGQLYDFVAQLACGAQPEALSLASDKITPTKGMVTVDTEASASTDNLTNILATNIGGKMLWLRTASAARVVTVKHNQSGSGKIILAGAADVVLDSPFMTLVLVYNTTTAQWEEVHRNFGLVLTASAKTTLKLQLAFGSAANADVGTGGSDLVTNDAMNAAIAAIAPALPSGVVLPYYGYTAPSGFIFPVGQEVSRTGATAGLYAIMGIQHGAGNGTTTFNLPDLRGRTLVGVDNMGGTAAGRVTASGSFNANSVGATGGAQAVALVVSNLPDHAHKPTRTQGYNNYSSSLGGLSRAGSGYDDAASHTGGVRNADGSVVAEGLGLAHLNMQPSITCNWIMKL